MGARPLRADLYRRFLAEVLELCECKVGAIVGDDAMGDPKPEGDHLKKFTAEVASWPVKGITSIYFVNLSTVTRRYR
jgi:hypothetical protein